MKICTVAVFLAFVASAYSSCMSGPPTVSVGPTISFTATTTTVVGETISCSDNPSFIVVNAEYYSPTVSFRYIILSIELNCDGSRYVRAIDSLTGFVICLPLFYEPRVGLEVVVVPLTGEYVYIVPNGGGCGFGYTIYLIYLDTCSGQVYLVDVIIGNVFLVQIGCYGGIELIPIGSLPDGVIQLIRETRVQVITTYGVMSLFITDLYNQVTYKFYLYERYGLLFTNDNFFGYEYVLRITSCGEYFLDRVYTTLGGSILIKTVDSTFLIVTRSTSYIDYITDVSSVGVMPYVKGSLYMRATITSSNSLDITNINTGVVNSYSLIMGIKSQYFVIDSLGNQLFVYIVNDIVTIYTVYTYGDYMYCVNPNTKQIQLLEFDSYGSVSFYSVDSISLSTLSIYRISMSYSITKISGVRYIMGNSNGYSFKSVLRVVSNLLTFRDDLTQMNLLVIDTDVNLPTLHECWFSDGGVTILDQTTLRLLYVEVVNGQYVYTDCESGITTFETMDTDMSYIMGMNRGSCAVC